MNPETSFPDFSQTQVKVDSSFSDIIPWFLDNRRDDIKKVKQYAEEKDFEQIQRMGHRWKGTCASYGFQKLSEAGELMEELAVRKDHDKILSLLDQSLEYINHLHVEYVPEDQDDLEGLGAANHRTH